MYASLGCKESTSAFRSTPEPGGERSEGLVQDVAVRATEGKLERINVDMDSVDLEDGSWIVTRRGTLNRSL
jgi:hypothetical protein